MRALLPIAALSLAAPAALAPDAQAVVMPCAAGLHSAVAQAVPQHTDTAAETAAESKAPASTPAQSGSVRPEIAVASPAAVRAEVTPSQVRLGEPFTLTIEVTDRPSERYELMRDFSLGPDVDVLDIQPSRTPAGDGLEVTRFTLRAALFALGEQALPTLRLQATGPDGDKRLDIDGPSIVGLGAIAEEDEAGYADILPPVQVGIASYLLLWILLGALAALGLFFGGVRLVRHLRSRPRKAPPPKPLDPLHVRALAALHGLREEDLPSQGRERELFFRLSEIERGYLGERYGFSALDMTTGELLAALGRLHTPGLDFACFERHCQEGDFVRFAKAPVPASACKRAIEEAIGLVQATTPPEVKAKTPSSPSTSTGAAA